MIEVDTKIVSAQSYKSSTYRVRGPGFEPLRRIINIFLFCAFFSFVEHNDLSLIFYLKQQYNTLPSTPVTASVPDRLIFSVEPTPDG